MAGKRNTFTGPPRTAVRRTELPPAPPSLPPGSPPLESLEFKEGDIQAKFLTSHNEMILEFRNVPELKDLNEKFLKIVEESSSGLLELFSTVPHQVRITTMNVGELIEILQRRISKQPWLDTLIASIEKVNSERYKTLRAEKAQKGNEGEEPVDLSVFPQELLAEYLQDKQNEEDIRRGSLRLIQPGVTVSFTIQPNKTVTYTVTFTTVQDAKQFHAYFRNHPTFKTIVSEYQFDKDVVLFDVNPAKQFADFRAALAAHPEARKPWCQELRDYLHAHAQDALVIINSMREMKVRPETPKPSPSPVAASSLPLPAKKPPITSDTASLEKKISNDGEEKAKKVEEKKEDPQQAAERRRLQREQRAEAAEARAKKQAEEAAAKAAANQIQLTADDGSSHQLPSAQLPSADADSQQSPPSVVTPSRLPFYNRSSFWLSAIVIAMLGAIVGVIIGALVLKIAVITAISEVTILPFVAIGGLVGFAVGGSGETVVQRKRSNHPDHVSASSPSSPSSHAVSRTSLGAVPASSLGKGKEAVATCSPSVVPTAMPPHPITSHTSAGHPAIPPPKRPTV